MMNPIQFLEIWSTDGGDPLMKGASGRDAEDTDRLASLRC